MGRSPAFDPDEALARLRAMQAAVREAVVQQRKHASGIAEAGLARAVRAEASDTIYALDAEIEPILEAAFADWAESTPLVLVAEGVHDAQGREGARRFSAGAGASGAAVRVICDPIDGTRGLMYDKRSAWSLAAVAPERGAATRLRDVEAAVMTELPTSKAGFADTLWAIRGRGAWGERLDLRTGETSPLALRPSTAETILHGFASVSSFFPGTKVLAAELMERIAATLLAPADVPRATVYDDQYVSTGGQWYELLVGHDRFNADLRPAFYRAQGLPEGMCCHPYDCAALLIAEEAGVIVTDEHGRPLDAPLDTTTGVNWLGYANAELRRRIEPVVLDFLRERGRASRAPASPKGAG